MSIPEPPSFDDFFNKQQAQRQQSTDSQHSQQNNQPIQGNNNGYGGFSTLAPGQPFQDEPGSLSRRDSNASMSGHRRMGSASSVNDRLRTVRREGSGDSSRRQDSFPFPIESTIISTASGVHQEQGQAQGVRNNIGDIMYGGSSPYQPQQMQQQQQQQPQHQQQHVFDQSQNYHPYTAQNSNGQQPYTSTSWTSNDQYGGMTGGQYSSQAQNFPMGTPSTAGSGYMLDQQSPFGSATFGGVGQQQGIQQQNGAWGSEFIGQENRNNGGEAFTWGGDAAGQESIDALLNVEDPLAELERISQVGSHTPSREPTPSQMDHNMSNQFQPDHSDQLFNQSVFDSAVSSRSTSPYPSAGMSQIISPPATGPFRRSSPSPNPSSPFFNKPQSPPALIIPNSQHSPSPVLPPIVTSTEHNAPHQQHNRAGAGTGGTAGGLFPPANPALEGLTGMAGISPIGPNADGPMIYIQPSTPISGLKDGRGVFDFKHATQAQQARQQAQQSQQQGNDGFNVPPPASHTISRHSSHEALDQLAQNQQNQQQDFSQSQQWNTAANQGTWSDLRPGNNVTRPRAKSDSQMGLIGSDVFDRQAYFGTGMPNLANMPHFSIPEGVSEDALRAAIDNWRLNTSPDAQVPAPTVDPRSLPGQDGQNAEYLNELKLSQQFAQLQAQRNRLPPLDTAAGATGKTPSGQFSPTSLAFYSQLGVDPRTASQIGTASAPFYQSTFQQLPTGQWPQTAGPAQQSFLTPEQGLGPRRRSFAEGTNHPAAGAGTPGYGVEFTRPSPFGTLDPGRIRGVSPGHRRAAKSEDLGRPTSGWGVGAGGSTADFLNSITANDGTLLPPSRGRSHSRQSSASSVRSASPALSVSSQGSSYGGSPGRMDMPDGVQIPQLYNETPRAAGKKRVAKMKVTSMATEVASSSRRTNDGVFKCPVPGCGSTFTRHFNLKGHLRSHNDERPYKCLYDGCPKAIVGFARQHDCKRHMLLHEGLRPFECEGCGKKFARLDALTRHHKSEQGQECAISHPLPVNPDGTPMSESQYKAYRANQHNMNLGMPFNSNGNGGIGGDDGGFGQIKREGSFQGYLSGDDRSGGEEDIGVGSGMEDYDRY